MIKTIIVLPDGKEVSSGVGSKNAIQSVTITQCVNASQELTLGSTCANMVEARLITPGGGLTIPAGAELTVYRVTETGSRYQVGLFLAEQPTRPTANTMELIMYDRVIKLDKDLTTWLAGLNAWPYSLLEFAGMVCTQCGLTLKNTQIPNGSYLVQKFSADGITGRQLMQWVGQIAGRFCRATAEGEIEFAWYTPAKLTYGPSPVYAARAYVEQGDLVLQAEDLRVTASEQALEVKSDLLQVEDDGQGNVTLLVSEKLMQQYYLQNGLSFADYSVAPIQKVQLRQNAQDVGTVYPDGLTEAVNTYSITGNYLLSSSTEKDLLPVAKTLYAQLKDVTYTPCKITVPANLELSAGNTVQITDRNGRSVTAWIMKRTQKGQLDTLECTGSANRQSSTAINNKRYEALYGKVLNLHTAVDGIRVENADREGRLSRLELDVDGIRSTVGSQQQNLTGITESVTTLEQTAEGLDVSVKKIQTDGVSRVETSTGYSFTEEGLRIKKSGQQIENLIDNTGMYVKRNDQALLTANAEGVEAHDVTVRNYLIVGDHARFEDYTGGRTACYYWEGS